MKIPPVRSFPERHIPIFAAVGVLVLTLIPLILFQPERKSKSEPAPASGKRIVLFCSDDVPDVKLAYQLSFRDPKKFLFPEEEKGFGFFRTTDLDYELTPIALRMPDAKNELIRIEPVPSVPLPSSPAAYRFPILPPVSEKVSSPAEGSSVPDVPVLLRSRITGIPEETIRKLEPHGPTCLAVIRPILPASPWHATVLQSCGASVLDEAAVRTMDRLLLQESFCKSLNSDLFFVYWQQPSAAGLQKEEEPHS